MAWSNIYDRDDSFNIGVWKKKAKNSETIFFAGSFPASEMRTWLEGLPDDFSIYINIFDNPKHQEKKTAPHLNVVLNLPKELTRSASQLTDKEDSNSNMFKNDLDDDLTDSSTGHGAPPVINEDEDVPF